MQNDHVFEDGFSIVKGTALSVAVSLLGVIIFAVILRTCALPDKIIYPVNQTIKAVAVILGVLCFISGEKGWMKGGVTGLLFTALSYLVFSVIGGDFSLSWLIFTELFVGAFVGMLSGIIAVNIKR